ncbi:beta-galactosidase [Dictyobacter arantiisoli]|uniref:Beta-galactosidase n=1 Tax=Dictyobacter arantiisoli TaxID=2014874 RepID=A0A5A5TI02_9CHLR|nr:beta-galactosidase [Dictyobacter arantiisoli]GCF11220.1 beta-galactosidase [Dictyobacter arantiisoli]
MQQPSFPPVNSRHPSLWHGGDYNPEQWPAEVWDEDVRLMQECGYTIATIGVFSWVSLQPAEDRFTFEWLDEVIKRLAAAGRVICLATPSAAQPAWMSQRYPDVLRVDEYGVRRHHGERSNYCPTSPHYRAFAVDMARRLAERYHQHPALALWHISNEYAGACYCDHCASVFRDWLKTRYSSLEDLNQHWWTAFWSHTYTSWDQIEPPYQNGEQAVHGLTLDYKRFQSEMMLECFKAERAAIRTFSQDIPITTNMMGTYPVLDYRAWAKELDVISWDNYPQVNAAPSDIAFTHDLNRGLRDGQPFLLMEQTPSSQNWQAVNALKRPGILRLWSYQAIAHGSDSVMYFQWRRGRGGCEKLHGAIIEHSGSSDTRVFREVSTLGGELAALQDRTLGAVTDARIGLLFDWENRWALEGAIGPVRDKRYAETVRQHYAALWQQHVPVDIIFSDSDLSRYQIVIAPMLYMLKPGVAERIAAFVEQGGTFITTYMSGMVDQHDLAFENGYPGPLRKVLGIWNEEIDALYPDQYNQIVMSDGSGSYPCNHLCALVRNEGASVLATYGSDFYANTPALTRNTYGAGTAYYLASAPDDAFLSDFYQRLCREHQIQPILSVPDGIEVTQRRNEQGSLLYLLNHNDQETQIALPAATRYRNLLRDRNQEVTHTITLDGYDVAILEELS